MKVKIVDGIQIFVVCTLTLSHKLTLIHTLTCVLHMHQFKNITTRFIVCYSTEFTCNSVNNGKKTLRSLNCWRWWILIGSRSIFFGGELHYYINSQTSSSFKELQFQANGCSKKTTVSKIYCFFNKPNRNKYN